MNTALYGRHPSASLRAGGGRPPRSVGAAGFTLVELLVATTISSLLVVSVVSATRALSSARLGVDERVARSASARRALETIAGALRNVRRDPIRDKPVIVGHSAGGGAAGDRIDLQVIGDCRSRPDGPESDQYEMSFFLARPEGYELPVLMSRSDHGLDEHPDDGGIATVVAEGIVGLSFEYYADDQWLAQWPISEPRPPEAVRVVVAAVGPQRPAARLPPRRLVLSTVVAIHANEPTALAPRESSPERERGTPGRSAGPSSPAPGSAGPPPGGPPR